VCYKAREACPNHFEGADLSPFIGKGLKPHREVYEVVEHGFSGLRATMMSPAVARGIDLVVIMTARVQYDYLALASPSVYVMSLHTQMCAAHSHRQSPHLTP
jgi:hypothetical protein